MCVTDIFIFNDTATTEIYTLSLHDALPIWVPDGARRVRRDDLRAPRPRPQHRGRLRGPSRPRLRGVLRHRGLQHGALELAGPRLAALRASVELLAVHLARGGRLGPPRRGDRRADAPRAR